MTSEQLAEIRERLKDPKLDGGTFRFTALDLLDEVERLRRALEEIAIFGEEGMKPDYAARFTGTHWNNVNDMRLVIAAWLGFHDKVAQIARQALGDGG